MASAVEACTWHGAAVPSADHEPSWPWFDLYTSERWELWCCDIDGVLPTSLSWEWLSVQECQRAARLVFERDRLRFRNTHAALRDLLVKRWGGVPGELGFRYGAHGKPHLLNGSGRHFNLSHSGGRVVVALSDMGEVGVDVELLCPVPDAPDLAGAFFACAEQSQLRSVPDANRDVAFLTCWTRKEACLKAIGSGLSIEPSTFVAGISSAMQNVGIYTPAGLVNLAVHTVTHPDDFVVSVAWPV